MPVDQEPVFGGAGARRPPATDLDPDHVVAAAPGPAAPVPRHGRRPPAPADVEDAPGLRAVRSTDRPRAVAHRQRSGGRPGLVLGRVGEQLVAPGDHHVERLVPGRERHVHVEVAGPPVGLGPGGGQPCAHAVVDQGQVEPVLDHVQRFAAGHVRQADHAGHGHHGRTALDAGSQVDPAHVGQTEHVDVGVDAGDDDVAGQHGPVVPPLGVPGAPAQVGAVQRRTGPTPGRRIQPGAIGGAEVDGCGQLGLVRGHGLQSPPAGCGGAHPGAGPPSSPLRRNGGWWRPTADPRGRRWAPW